MVHTRAVVAPLKVLRKRCSGPTSAMSFLGTQVRRTTTSGDRSRGSELFARQMQVRPASISTHLQMLDYSGTFCFACFGALAAVDSGAGLLGLTTVGLTSAIGGGTVRDLIIFRVAPFWLKSIEYVVLGLIGCCSALCFSFFDSRKDHFIVKAEILNVFPSWSQQLGLSTFAVVGTMQAVKRLKSPILSLVCGIITATGGGLICDVPKIEKLCNRRSSADITDYKSEKMFKIMSAASSSAVYLATTSLCLSPPVRIISGLVSGLLPLPLFGHVVAKNENLTVLDRSSCEHQGVRDRHTT